MADQLYGSGILSTLYEPPRASAALQLTGHREITPRPRRPANNAPPTTPRQLRPANYAGPAAGPAAGSRSGHPGRIPPVRPARTSRHARDLRRDLRRPAAGSPAWPLTDPWAGQVCTLLGLPACRRVGESLPLPPGTPHNPRGTLSCNERGTFGSSRPSGAALLSFAPQPHTGRGTMKLRVGEPWMPAKDYGRSLHGLTVNLLVADLEAALAFQREVLGATVVYSDPDFAVCSAAGAEWMLHADHTYDKHPMRSTLNDTRLRGAGLEIRLHGCDPDAAEAAARRAWLRSPLPCHGQRARPAGGVRPRPRWVHLGPRCSHLMVFDLDTRAPINCRWPRAITLPTTARQTTAPPTTPRQRRGACGGAYGGHAVGPRSDHPGRTARGGTCRRGLRPRSGSSRPAATPVDRPGPAAGPSAGPLVVRAGRAASR